jgi:ATP-dependent Clp protease ATP-binding subunit ClpA
LRDDDPVSARFSESSRQALSLAQEEARGFGHDRIGTEHILLGVLREGVSAGAQTLSRMGVTPELVRVEVRRLVGPGHEVAPGTIALTAGAKQALELAPREARSLGRDLVGTEHLLLGLLEEDEGVAAIILTQLGVDLGAIRAEFVGLADAALDDLTGPAGDGTTPPVFAAWLGSALTQAAAEATADGRPIEVTDFMVALASDPQSPTGWVLAELGVDGASLRATAEHLRLLDREIGRVGRELHDASEAGEETRAAGLRDQRRQLIAQRQRRAAPDLDDDLDDDIDGDLDID